MKNKSAFWSYLVGAPRENIRVLNVTKRSKLPLCKYCGSGEVVRYGYYQGIPRWWCKGCRRKFAENGAAPGMKTPREEVALALSLYCEGAGLKTIRWQLKQKYSSYPSGSTIYEWFERAMKGLAVAESNCQPVVGEFWLVTETEVKIGIIPAIIWDIFDVKTRFLLVSRLFTQRTEDNAAILMAEAIKIAGKNPRIVISDKLAVYLNGIKGKTGLEIDKVSARDLTGTDFVRLMERIKEILAARTKIIRGLRKINNASFIIQGWLVHYNYLRPHELISCTTPAQRAGITQALRVSVRKPS